MRDNSGVVPESWPPITADDCIGPAAENDIRDWSLVITAVGIPHTLIRNGGDWFLKMHPFLLENAVRQLRLWRNEEPLANPQLSSPAVWRPAFLIPLLPAVVYLFIGIFWNRDAAVRLLGVSADHLSSGELWRPVTALFVHSGGFHLLFNTVLLMLIAPFIRESLGPGCGWSSVLFASICANAVAAGIRGGVIVSIGASTAVFVLIGMALILRLRFREEPSWRRALVVLGTGLLFIVLSRGKMTDHSAHLCGICCGMLSGFLYLTAVGRSLSVKRRSVQLLWALAGGVVLSLSFITPFLR